MFLLPSCMHLPSLPAAARVRFEFLLKKSSLSCKNVPGAAASLASNSRTDASCGWMPTAEMRVGLKLPAGACFAMRQLLDFRRLDPQTVCNQLVAVAAKEAASSTSATEKTT